MKTSVKYEVIYRHREKYSISEMCRFFGVSRSGYYDYIRRMDVPAKDLPLARRSESVRLNVAAPTVTAESTSGQNGTVPIATQKRS